MKIEAERLVKNYGLWEVIKNVSFSLESGEILGFLGPNGAGKTTIMRMLAGFHFPDSGSIKINGKPLDENSFAEKNLIGYLPENAPLYPDMTPGEYLAFMANIRLIPKKERKDKIEKSLRLWGLKTREHQRIDTLSRGYKQRLGLAQALFHDPAFIILDEALTGLDPGQIIEARGILKEIGKENAIIFSTHILQDAASICTRYLILDEGRIAAQGLMDSGTGTENLERVFLNINGLVRTAKSPLGQPAGASNKPIGGNLDKD